MYKLIPLLTDPASHGGDAGDSFDVVAPSLPGFGFSDHPTEPGVEVAKTAALWEELMTQVLDYPRFAAHGGDIGAGVTANLGYGHADSMIGIHLTSITRPMPYLGEGAAPLTEAEKAHMRQREEWQQNEGAYAHMQGTKPQTLSYGLNDSPVGLAAWIVEKYRTWSDCDGDVERRFTKDELLTTVTIYWATSTIGSSTRMYKEKPEIHVDDGARREDTGPRREWLRSRSNSAVLRESGASAPTTCGAGLRCREEATSRLSRSHGFSPRTSASSSGPERRLANQCTDNSVLTTKNVHPRIKSGAGSELVEGRFADHHNCVDSTLYHFSVSLP